MTYVDDGEYDSHLVTHHAKPFRTAASAFKIEDPAAPITASRHLAISTKGGKEVETHYYDSKPRT